MAYDPYLQGAGAAYQPGQGVPGDDSSMGVDPSGNLAVRGQTLTDEGSYRANFANTSLAVSIGSATLTNGAKTITWSISATTDIQAGQYIKLDADAESAWAQIESIDSLTSGTLVSNYTGTGGTGAASRSVLDPYTGAGGSISVGSGILTITSGTTNSSVTGVTRVVDYGPMVYRARVAISARNSNQDIRIGLSEDASTIRWFARFVATGTTNTVITFETGRNPTTSPSANETETTTITLPSSATTVAMNDYRIELMHEQVVAYINDVVVARHARVVPGPLDTMASLIEVRNGTGASACTITSDFISCKNHNKLEVGIFSNTEQLVASTVPATDLSYSVAGVISINTVIFTVDCTQLRTLSIQTISMGTTGVVTPEWSNDNGTTWSQGLAISTTATGQGYATTWNNANFHILPVLGRLFRLRLSTATTAGTTTLRLAGFQQSAAIIPNSQTVTASNLSCNVAQVAGNTPITLQPNGSTNRAITTAVAGPSTLTDYSAQAWSAASGSGATIAQTSGLGGVASFDVNLTAWTAGASTGLVVYLQESPDNGTTWYDIWQCEVLTAVSRARIPAIPIGGRRRMRWVNLSGAATTATVTVTAMDCSLAVVKQVQWFDRTSGVGSGTAVLNTNSAAYDIAACKAMTVVMQAGTASAVGSFQVQMSMDGTNWYTASAATAIASTAANQTVIPITAGVYGRFIRVTCTAAGTTQVINAIHIYGTN